MDDSSDATIVFDDQGRCNYCTKALTLLGTVWHPGSAGQQKLDALLSEVKKAGAGKRYDCIMGLSGGLDSSYLAMLGHQWGLRVLAVHIDDGFDTEITRRNLSAIVAATGFDYMTIQPDTHQFNALTKAYMRAGVPNLAVPQDNVLFAFLYDCMKRNTIKYFFTGSNYALESILQRGNSHTATDIVNLVDIHRRFGSAPINQLKFISTLGMVADQYLRGMRTVAPLNYVDYGRSIALAELAEFCGFEYYGRKHLENTLTEFVQLYWLYHKFGVDKRTSHLSSMIISGEMTRDEALAELSEPVYQEPRMSKCIAELKQALLLTDGEFDELMSAPAHQHTDYEIEERTTSYKVTKRLIKLAVDVKNWLVRRGVSVRT